MKNEELKRALIQCPCCRCEELLSVRQYVLSKYNFKIDTANTWCQITKMQSLFCSPPNLHVSVCIQYIFCKQLYSFTLTCYPWFEREKFAVQSHADVTENLLLISISIELKRRNIYQLPLSVKTHWRGRLTQKGKKIIYILCNVLLKCIDWK